MTSIRGPGSVSAYSSNPNKQPISAEVGGGDRGLMGKITFDAKTNTIRIPADAVAVGREAVDSRGVKQKNDFDNVMETGGGVNVTLDRDKKPDFSKNKYPTASNKWNENHQVNIGTKEGQDNFDVANNLAAEIKKKPGYRAKVEKGEDGSALVVLSRY